MQTQLMQPWDKGVPWLERFLAGSDSPERTPLQTLPFTIGRIDTADLQIDSTRVSREHAVIVKEGDEYHVRDLGSTNGTYVNGQRIQEHALIDGDVVVIADSEFTFVAATVGATPRNMATQVIEEAKIPAGPQPSDQILAVRRLQESLLHRSFLPRLKPIVDLERSSTFAFRSEPVGTGWKETELEPLASAASATCQSIWRAQQVYRMLSAEAFLNLDADALLFVDVKTDEIERGAALEAHLNRLSHVVGEKRLVVGLPANAVSDYQRVRDFRDRLKNAGFRLAFLNFLGGRPQVMALADSAPEFLVLASNLVTELHTNARQSRQLQAVHEACHEIGARPIVTGLKSREDEDDCFKLGFRLIATERLGRPMSTSVPKLLKNDARVECLT
ncbi:MAG TPA: FHA domain-containing protein [Pirellulaceae bacterium]|nr:FHA domain-containing protein [Pirellulaceae bacterium]